MGFVCSFQRLWTPLWSVGRAVVSPSRDRGWRNGVGEEQKWEWALCPKRFQGLGRPSTDPAAFVCCQPGNLVKNAGKWNGLGQVPALEELLEVLNLLWAAGGECVPSAASPAVVTFLPLLHSKKFPHFTWMVLLPKKQHFSYYLELEPFLAWGLLYLTGRNILSGFSVSFGSLMSMDIFWWTPSPADGVSPLFLSFICTSLSSGLTTLFTFSFVICWNLWQEELEWIRTNEK